MLNALLPDLETLLSHEMLSRFSDQPIVSSVCSPLVAGHSASGSHLHCITTNAGAGPTFILKRMSLEWDWIMRATLDHAGRETVVWQTGFLDALPPEVAHAVLACARDGAGWAILMQDASAFTFPARDPYLEVPISDAQNRAVLRGLAALHAQSWEQPLALPPELGFCQPGPRLGAFSQTVAQREAAIGAAYVEIMRAGWNALPDLIETDLAETITHLANDPSRLAAAHASLPMTAIHGDPRPPNLGIVPRADGSLQLLLFDWQFAGPGWATTDLAWYLYCASSNDAILPEPSIAIYRETLAEKLGDRFDVAWWRPLLALGLLGQFVRCAQDLAWAACFGPEPRRAWARRALVWWRDRAVGGLAALQVIEQGASTRHDSPVR